MNDAVCTFLLWKTCVYKLLHRQHLFGYMPSSWTGVTILGHMVSTFSLLRSQHVFQSGSTTLQCMSSNLFTCSLTFIVIPAFDDSHPRGILVGISLWFWFEFPQQLIILSIFPRAYWPLIYNFWRNVYWNVLPIADLLPFSMLAIRGAQVLPGFLILLTVSSQSPAESLSW